MCDVERKGCKTDNNKKDSGVKAARKIIAKMLILIKIKIKLKTKIKII